MKTSTTIFTLLMGMMICTSIHAQSLSARGGLNLSSTYGDNSEDEEFEKWKPGFHVGLNLELPVYKNLSFLTGLNLSTRGMVYKVDESEIIDGTQYTIKLEYKLSMTYLEIPLSMRYRFPINKNTKIYTDAGCYLAYAVAGKEQFNIEVSGESESETESVNWENYKRQDVGLTFGAGVEINKFQMGVHMDYGLLGFSNWGIVKNQNIRFSVAYRIFSAK